MCSLHLDPLAHTPEQLVVQSLFADGFITYSVCEETEWERRSPAFQLLALDEQILPNSSQAMTWAASEIGMRMSLSRDVPERLAEALAPFVQNLLLRAGLGAIEQLSASFAVHPGGPKILDRAQAVLELKEAQLASSRKVLRERGNMSSATLPHIWLDMAADPGLKHGALVISLAFGPGLTLCGAVLRKLSQ
jgi:predicted naringenin-chalcone synthase